MFGLFRNTKKEQPSSGPFGVTIGEQAVGSKIIGAPASFPYPYGPHGELFDEKYRHSFHRINPPEFHQLFHSFYGRYVNPFGNGRSTGLSLRDPHEFNFICPRPRLRQLWSCTI